jgi:hypothetical protein
MPVFLMWCVLVAPNVLSHIELRSNSRHRIDYIDYLPVDGCCGGIWFQLYRSSRIRKAGAHRSIRTDRSALPRASRRVATSFISIQWLRAAIAHSRASSRLSRRSHVCLLAPCLSQPLPVRLRSDRKLFDTVSLQLNRINECSILIGISFRRLRFTPLKPKKPAVSPTERSAVQAPQTEAKANSAQDTLIRMHQKLQASASAAKQNPFLASPPLQTGSPLRLTPEQAGSLLFPFLSSSPRHYSRTVLTFFSHVV